MDRSFAHNTVLSRDREVLNRKSDDDAIQVRPSFAEGHSR
jgi:hypothetical protein